MSLLDQHRTLCKLRGQLEWRLQNIFQNLAFNPPHAFLNKTCTGLIFFRKPLGSYSQNSLKKKERERKFLFRKHKLDGMLPSVVSGGHAISEAQLQSKDKLRHITSLWTKLKIYARKILTRFSMKKKALKLKLHHSNHALRKA